MVLTAVCVSRGSFRELRAASGVCCSADQLVSVYRCFARPEIRDIRHGPRYVTNLNNECTNLIQYREGYLTIIRSRRSE